MKYGKLKGPSRIEDRRSAGGGDNKGRAGNQRGPVEPKRKFTEPATRGATKRR